MEELFCVVCSGNFPDQKIRRKTIFVYNEIHIFVIIYFINTL